MTTTREQRHVEVMAFANRAYGAIQLVFAALFAQMAFATLFGSASTSAANTTHIVEVAGIGMSPMTLLLALSAAIGLPLGAATVRVGGLLIRREGTRFCVVVSAINALSVPFGTLLGILTIVLVTRPAASDT